MMAEIIAPLFVPVSPENVKYVAVALSRNHFDGELRSHASIIYRTSIGEATILDFLLNGQIRSVPADRAVRRHRFTWAVPQFPDIVLQAIARFCETLGESSQSFPYWIDFPADSRFFDAGNSIELRGGAVGLTCATFVLAVFASLRKSLLNMDTWTEGDDTRKAEDEDWQHWILSKLRDNPPAYGISAELMQRGEQRIPFLRYRPEDLVWRVPARATPDALRAV